MQLPAYHNTDPRLLRRNFPCAQLTLRQQQRLLRTPLRRSRSQAQAMVPTWLSSPRSSCLQSICVSLICPPCQFYVCVLIFSDCVSSYLIEIAHHLLKTKKRRPQGIVLLQASYHSGKCAAKNTRSYAVRACVRSDYGALGHGCQLGNYKGCDVYDQQISCAEREFCGRKKPSPLREAVCVFMRWLGRRRA